MIKELQKEEVILSVVNRSDYIKGKKYYKPYIEFYNKENFKTLVSNIFHVESERTSRIYICHIILNKETKRIEKTLCDCQNFQNTKSCKHIAACLYHAFDEIMPKEKSIEYKEMITNNIFKTLREMSITKTKREVKKEVSIEFFLDGENLNANMEDSMQISLRVGEDKLYQCKGSKLKGFLEAIINENTYSFGKNFTYDPSKNYFSNENKEILNYIRLLISHNSNYYYNSSYVIYGNENIKNFIELTTNKKLTINNYLIGNVIDGFPMDSYLVNNSKNKYTLKFDVGNEIVIITSDLEYVQIENSLYHLDRKKQMLLCGVLANELDELVFDRREKEVFQDVVLPMIKNQIQIDSQISDIIISNNVTIKLFFDMYYDKIKCNLVLDYDGHEINYFDKNDIIVRDKEKEEEVLDYLFQYGFQIQKDKLLLEDITDIGYFLDEVLKEVTEKYETYTSEKLKKINIIKKNNISSTFSIGQDNIMSYSFDLGNIKEEEIVNVLESLKDKKKYYRLKSGDIIDLEDNQELEQLDRLATEMNLKSSDLKKGFGEIPKYRAIYLDSLKNNRYSIIKTDNLFDKLISDFKEYQDSEIKLTSKEKKLLRPYQIEGIKWLYTIDKTGFGGILADEMGLGKSVQTIYYIKELLKEDNNNKFLIVAPTSLIYNWENEFIKFASNLKYKVMAGNRQTRRENLENIEDYNIIITTYGLLREDKVLYSNIAFRTIIIDEAQNIKNINTDVSKTVKSMKSKTKMALTGTPIENSVLELYSIFDFIMPGFLGELDNFSKKYKIRDFDDDTNQKISSLNKLVSPFILRRKKKDVIKDLPEKIENNIYVELTKEQKQIYVAELQKIQKEMDDIIATGGISKARFLILKLLTKLRQICIDPRILFDGYTGGSCKMEEFIKTVQESINNNHKILVFTSFKSALELARRELSNLGITSYTIDGAVSAQKRMTLVDNFNNDDTNVFFIMLKAGGTGLNLTSADVVIHLDLWWNPQAENQATDRAHRIGQKNVVEVIRFITKGTIEEKILNLQEKKRILSDKLIDENNSEESFSKLTEKDIKELLSFENKEEL